MSLFSSLFDVVLPAFIVMAVGVLVGRVFKPDLQSINRIALYSTVPALIFSSLSKMELDFASVARLAGSYGLFLGAMLLLSGFLFRPFASATTRGLVATSTFANSANLLLPVALFAFGEEGLAKALILYVITSVSMFSIAPLVLAGGKGVKLPIAKVLALPVLWAAVAALLINVLGIAFPLGISRGIDILANAAVPLVLLVLGMQIERTGLRMPTLANWLGTAFKLLAGPIIAYSIARLLGMTGLDLAMLTLIGAMPPAVNTFMLALEFGGNAEEVARTVVLSTLLALISVSVVVSLIA